MEATRPTVAEFISRRAVKYMPTRVPPTTKEQADWPGGSHYVVSIHVGKSCERFVYHQGAAHKKPPTLASVLDSLASDATTAEQCQTFTAFLGEFVGSTDAVTGREYASHRRAYRGCKSIWVKLLRLLGREAYRELLDTERE